MKVNSLIYKCNSAKKITILLFFVVFSNLFVLNAQTNDNKISDTNNNEAY